MQRATRLVLGGMPFVLAACTRAEPPGAAVTSGATSASVAALPASLATLPAAAPPPVDAAAPVDAALEAEAAVTDPGKLPQTPDKPQPSGAAWEAHVASLWDAIVHDDPDRAAAFFFPVDAYAQIKDIPNPPADWKGRLWRAYTHDIHALHQRLGEGADSAKFLRIEVPNDAARWVKPHEEFNSGSYWRVFGTKVHYEEGGKEHTFDIKSLISWRGEWYVVHLSAIK